MRDIKEIPKTEKNSLMILFYDTAYSYSNRQFEGYCT